MGEGGCVDGENKAWKINVHEIKDNGYNIM